MNRKQFTKLFLPFNESGKQIWVISKIKELHPVIVQMAVNLAALDFISYVWIGDESLAASSENYPKRPKVPVTQMGHETAIGIDILYDIRHKTIDFYEINSPLKGKDTKMVDAVLKDLPKGWTPAVAIQWSNGFWEKMVEKHKDFKWLM